MRLETNEDNCRVKIAQSNDTTIGNARGTVEDRTALTGFFMINM